MSFLDQINLKFFLVLQFYSPVEEAHTQQEENAGFPDGSVIKNPPANARDTCLIPGHDDPWSRRSSGEGNCNPFQCSCPGNPMDREA